MTLATELSTDPLVRGYAGMTDVEAAADLNTTYRTRYRELTTRDMLRWGFAREGLAKLRDAADKAGAYTAITDINRAKAIASYSIMTAGIEGSLDVGDPEIDAMLDLLVATGIFVAQDKTDLLARATESISRTQELGLPMVLHGDVTVARAV